MTSSKPKNNWEKTMENVDNALGKEVDAAPHDMAVIHPSSERIYQRIIDNFDRIENMLTGVKAKEYGDPQAMCRHIGQRWFGCDDTEVDVAIMMAELKIERIKHDQSKEDSYMDAIAYLAMALAFMQEEEKND